MRSSMTLRIAGALVLVVALNTGCATPLTVIPMLGQSADQTARDEAECLRESPENTRYAWAIGQGLRTKLSYALGGAAIGAMASAPAADDASTADKDKDAALSLGIGTAAGFVIGLVVGTYQEAEAATRAARDVAAEAFQRCMKDRGYTVVRDRSPR